MIGYKAFNHDLQCRGYQYNVNEEHVHHGYFEICDSGFHFCLTIDQCFRYYNRDACVVYKVQVPDYTKEFNDVDADKWVTNKIQLLEKVYDSRDQYAYVRENPEKFINDESCDVRAEAAKLIPAKFINDEDWCVRREAAKLIPEKFINDPNYAVRLEAAKLIPEKFINDSDTEVQIEVAKVYPEKFINDPNYYVRREAAKLLPEQFINDSHYYVRKEVAKHLADKFINDPSWRVRVEVAKVFPEKLINDQDIDVRRYAKHTLSIKKYIIS